MNEDKQSQVSIPFIMETMSTHNRRMLIALLSVCVTFILTIVIFVVGYTIREKNWLDTLMRLERTQVEVQNGVYQQPDQTPD